MKSLFYGYVCSESQTVPAAQRAARVEQRGGGGAAMRRLGVHFINKHKRRIFHKITTLSDESEAGNYANSHLPHVGMDGIIK